MNKTSVISGGGSGVGGAIALKLVRQGWRVAIVGRRAEALQETIRLASPHASRITHHVCDVGDPAAVAAMSREVLAEFPGVELLVNAAGLNVPRRCFSDLRAT